MITYRVCGAWLCAVVILLVCCGCVDPLPPGLPPEGGIVNNPISKKLTRQEMILAVGSRIAASSMEHFPGGPVALDSDKDSALIAKAAIAEAGKICGVRLELAAAPVLTVRTKGNTVMFELFYFSRSLWRSSFELEK